MKPETKKVLEQIMHTVSLSNMSEEEKAVIQQRVSQIYYIESPDTKVGKLDMYKFCASPKQNRGTLEGIYYDPEGYMVACDSYILVAIKGNIEEGKKGKIISKKGNEIEGRYPNWQSVVPSDASLSPCRIDISEALDVCKQLAAMEKGNIEGHNDYAIKIDGVRFSYKKFQLILSAMNAIGTDVIMISHNGRACKIGKDDDSCAILMPFIEEDEDTKTRTIALKNVEVLSKVA